MTELSDATKAMIVREKARQRRRRVRRVIVLAFLLVLCGAAALTYVKTRPAPPPALDADPLLLARFAATDEFAKLSEDQKLAYIDKLMGNMIQLMQAYRDKKITDQERDKAMENVGLLMIRRTVEGYFNQPAAKEREAYLDQLIDQQEGVRLKFRLWPTSRPATQPATRPRPPGGNMDPAMIKKFLEKMPPALRAQWAEFARAMQDRREARGLPGRMRGPM